MIDHREVQALILRPAKAKTVSIRFLTATRDGLGQLITAAVADGVTPFTVTWASDRDAPKRARSLGLTAEGLRLLGISDRARAALPAAFMEGMAAAAPRLGDPPPGGNEWDPPLGWRGTSPADPTAPWHPPPVHAVLIDAGTTPSPDLPSGVEALAPSWEGVRREGLEPFGFRDDITNPVVDGGPGSTDVKPGNGVWDAKAGRWRPVAPGELLLGHVDEIGTISGHPDAAHLERNGSYLVIRRLQQEVEKFNAICVEWATELEWKDAEGKPDAPRVAAQLVGRHQDGTPLGREDQPGPSNDFLYRDARFCPVKIPPSAHIHRANPRDSLEFADKIVARHTIFRRGYPYGTAEKTEEGLLFMACCADLRRQFEFIQASWLEDGDRFGLGLESDAIAGRRPDPLRGDGQVSVDDGGNRARKLFGSYVHLRGGEYALLPSKAALRLLAPAKEAS